MTETDVLVDDIHTKKDFMKLYREAVRVEEISEQELERLRCAQMGRGIQYSDMPVSHGNPHGLDAYAAEADEMLAIIRRDRFRCMELFRETRACIDTVHSMQERQVLTERYLSQKWRFRDIARTLCYSERYVINLHGKALADMTLTPRAKALLIEARGGEIDA